MPSARRVQGEGSRWKPVSPPSRGHVRAGCRLHGPGAQLGFDACVVESPSPPVFGVLVCLPPHVQIVEGVGVRGGQWLTEVGALWVEGTWALSQGPPPPRCPASSHAGGGPGTRFGLLCYMNWNEGKFSFSTVFFLKWGENLGIW